jgi:cytochrome P450
MMRLTLQIVGKTLFSADLEQDAEGIGESLKQALQVFVTLNNPIAQLVPPVYKWAQRKAIRSRREIEAVLRKVIEEHRRNPHLDDMLSMLMRSQDDAHGGYMSEELLLDECLTLFLAGHETTANALTWTWYLLAQHPEVMHGVQSELRHTLNGRQPTIESLTQLEYTTRVFREALRLYPPAWIIAREAVTAYRLGNVDVPAGATIIMSPFATHRDGRFWQSPQSFEPDRWLKDASLNRPKFAFFPFGAGTRVCIGEHFATMEGVLILATIAQQWSPRFVPGQNIQMWPQITLRPRHPMHFQLERIETRSLEPSSDSASEFQLACKS